MKKNIMLIMVNIISFVKQLFIFKTKYKLFLTLMSFLDPILFKNRLNLRYLKNL